MTRRKDQLRRRSYNDLFKQMKYGDESAKEALRTLQKIREAGGTFEIWHIEHHG